ncbi:hypothetical protein BaRGS_00007004 [Batillaria attramentaria]|uniref:Uncharacterized protein n=1 Tax=Batillaria attramentaria TaxID=370345 RepID=A0ABD0LRA8_9CAEN
MLTNVLKLKPAAPEYSRRLVQTVLWLSDPVAASPQTTMRQKCNFSRTKSAFPLKSRLGYFNSLANWDKRGKETGGRTLQQPMDTKTKRLSSKLHLDSRREDDGSAT